MLIVAIPESETYQSTSTKVSFAEISNIPAQHVVDDLLGILIQLLPILCRVIGKVRENETPVGAEL